MYIRRGNQCVDICMALCLHTPTADTDGFVKVLSDAKTDRVLGVHIIGSVSHTHTHTLTYHTHTLTDSRGADQ